MNCFKGVMNGVKAASLPNAPCINGSFKRFRKPSTCDICLYPPDKRPCFDIRNVTVEFGNQCHAKLIRSFLYTHYWPREPTIVGLWVALDCPYLNVLTDKYSYSGINVTESTQNVLDSPLRFRLCKFRRSDDFNRQKGDRFLAFEYVQRTGERKLIGVCVANKILPWLIDELEEWAHYTASKPERHRMYLSAHCLKTPKLFEKYHVPYLYDIEVLGTASEVAGQGVGKLLLSTALGHAHELRHPLAQLVSVNQYTSKICEKVGMKREWTMNYTEFVDHTGQRVFYPRRPHQNVSVYTKAFDPKKGGELPCKPQFFKTR